MKRNQVKVENFAWGAIFSGSKEALIKAGYLDPRNVPTQSKNSNYWLPLNWGDGYNAACFGPTFGPIPPRWDATASFSDGEYRVNVWYDALEVNGTERARAVIAEMEDGRYTKQERDLVRRAVEYVMPRPLPEIMKEAFAKAKKFPKRG